MPGPTSGHPFGLRRLVAGDRDAFAAQGWGRSPLLSRAKDLAGGFDDLLEPGAVDELVSQRGLRTPFLRVAKDGTTLGDRVFTAPGGTGAGIADQVSDDKLVALFADGATLVLQGLHRLWPPIITFAQQLAADLGHPVQVNAYVTPPTSRGFSDHYDVHDVFVLQVEGEKRWSVHAPVHESPLRDQPWTDHRAAVERAAGAEPTIDTVLRPGDVLYLPRGTLHAATALGGISTHLTVGVHIWTRFTLAEQLVAEAVSRLGGDSAVRASLGLGVCVGDPDAIEGDVELVRDRLLKALSDVRAADVAAGLAGPARDAQRAAPVGPLAQLRAGSDLHDDDLLQLRSHLDALIAERVDGSAELRSRAATLRLEDGEADVVRMLLAGDPTPVARIGRDLARRLLASAVLVPSRR